MKAQYNNLKNGMSAKINIKKNLSNHTINTLV